MQYLDVIVPVKNEAENVGDLVRRINASLNQADISHQIIFVDDHSTDSTVDILHALSKEFPVRVYKKLGKKGKAYSILEGVRYSTADTLAMIDGDLQYPPEAISEMFQKTTEHGVVVAKRQKYNDSSVRKVFSKSFKYLFGKLLFNFNCDVQSGLKLFKREIIERVEEKDVSGWTLDIPLLHTALDMGYTIGEVDISFEKRTKGTSKVNTLMATTEIASKAISIKMRPKKVYIMNQENNQMQGSGVAYNRKRYVTHTTLHPDRSAIKVLSNGQKIWLWALAISLIALLIWNFLIGLQVVVAILSFIYFVDVLFNFYLIYKSLHTPPEITISEQELSTLNDKDLPIYTILCPLYKEASVLPLFMDSISKMDYPKEKMEVMLLLEEDDLETQQAAKELDLPSFMKVVVVPDSQPKTKPKACNYGLTQATGEYLVIYDAEDIPDPLQLKKAYLAFKKADSNVICLQAKLNYHNPFQNTLTRLFTAEYSLWFDVTLTGLQSIATTIPLGGTSNHFKTKDLHALQGWDPFNVTEDCDLGLRLFNKGFKTAIIDSTTLEEANSDVKNWIRQRSRWIKGYMQTYLVHMRNPIELARNQKWHSLVFQLVVGGKIAFIFINPFLWVMTIAYFAFRQTLGPAIESLYPTFIFYIAATSLVFGNFLFMYYYMIGVAKREQWSLMKFVFLVPLYWLLVSWAGMIGLYQLIVKPHYWEKTIHGLHMAKTNKSKKTEDSVIIEEQVKEEIIEEDLIQKEAIEESIHIPRARLPITGSIILNSQSESKPNKFALFLSSVLKKLGFAKDEQDAASGAFWLVVATMLANVVFFFSSTFLGRSLSLEEFGILSLFGGFLFISQVLINSYSAMIIHRASYLFGKGGKELAADFINVMAGHALKWGIGASIIWIIVSIWLSKYFQVNNLIPFLLFTPVWLSGLWYGVYFGGLKGIWDFSGAGNVVIVSAVVKLVASIGFVFIGRSDLVILVISLPIVAEVILSWWYLKRKNLIRKVEVKKPWFDWMFFSSAVIVGLSGINFLGLDIILAKAILSPDEAGKYGLLTLVGRIVFFLGSIFLSFIIPLVAKNTAQKKSNKKFLFYFIGLTALPVLISVLTLGIFGSYFVPILYGHKTDAVLSYLPLYVSMVAIFTVAQPVIYYLQAKKNYVVAMIGIVVTLLQVGLTYRFAGDIWTFLQVMFALSIVNLALSAAILFLDRYRWITKNNLKDLQQLLFLPVKTYSYPDTNGVRVLILNWRDNKHRWAGGAETYVHQLARKWVESGHQVTIFSGNDGHSSRHEIIDGVRIIRRGGIYTVYVWAFLYYVLRLRGLFDVVVDSENGIPFFTPFYVRIPKFLLIHHIHQEVFREHLKFPLAQIGMFLEAVLMPFVYRKSEIVTVSQSSKQEIIKLGLGSDETINVVHPGVNLADYNQSKKTRYPSLLYLGRLKPYKNIDVLIKAFEKVLEHYPKAVLNIVGDGEQREDLEKQVKNIKLENKVAFLGKVDEEQKMKLLGSSWIFLQPSMIEGWGITVIEANACGTPVIASDVFGLRDSVAQDHTGKLIEPRNTELWAQTITHLLSNHRLRKKLSQNSYSWSQNYDWTISAQKLMQIIQQKIKKPRNFELRWQSVSSNTNLDS